MTYGSPAVLHGESQTDSCIAALERAKVTSAPPVRVSPATCIFLTRTYVWQVHSHIYGADLVPRLLGAEIPLLMAALERFSDEPLLEERRKVLRTLSGYVHYDAADVIYINPVTSDARVVPPRQLPRIVHIHKSASVDAIAHHSKYVEGLQCALEKAEARERMRRLIC